MPRTWSYRKYSNDQSAAERERNPPSNLTIYTIVLISITTFFMLFMIYNTVRTVMHPPKEDVAPQILPKDD